MKVSKLFEEIERLKPYKSIPGFESYGWRDDPAAFVKTAPLEIKNRKRYAEYLKDRKKRYQYNDRELGQHGLRVDAQNEWHAHYKIEDFEKATEEIEKDLKKLHAKGLHNVLQKTLINIPSNWRNKI
jgi:magnesium-transporting ATPase (P-type)